MEDRLPLTVGKPGPKTRQMTNLIPLACCTLLLQLPVSAQSEADRIRIEFERILEEVAEPQAILTPDDKIKRAILWDHFLNNKDSALSYYNAFQSRTNNSVEEVKYLKALCLYFKKDFPAAAAELNSIALHNLSPDFAQKVRTLEEKNAAALGMRTNASHFVLENVEVLNTGRSETVPLFDRKTGQMLYTVEFSASASDQDPVYVYNLFPEFYDQDIFSCTFPNGAAPDPRTDLVYLNTERNESVVSLSPGGDTLFTFREGKLYAAQRRADNTWSDPEKLPRTINFGKYQRHICLSPDGKRAYVSSENAQGDFDLYVLYKQPYGGFGEPRPLANINTEGNEDAPFLTQDGRYLYFSSDGPGSMGGYDIFRARLDVNGLPLQTENLGMPVNSPGHELHFTMTDEVQGYLASDRHGGKGAMDIYHFYQIDPVTCPYLKLELVQKVGFPEGPDELYRWRYGTQNLVGAGDTAAIAFPYPGEYSVVRQPYNGNPWSHTDSLYVDLRKNDFFTIYFDRSKKGDKIARLDASHNQLQGGKAFLHRWRSPSRNWLPDTSAAITMDYSASSSGLVMYYGLFKDEKGACKCYCTSLNLPDVLHEEQIYIQRSIIFRNSSLPGQPSLSENRTPYWMQKIGTAEVKEK